MGVNLLLEGVAGTLEPKQRDILEVCREDTARLEGLMRQLLDLSRIESGAVTPIRAAVQPSVLVREAADAVRVQAGRKGIDLVLDAPPELPTISADRDQIERVIGNLVTNALRATPAGGTITIAAVHRDAEMAFSVADTGTGIPREYLRRSSIPSSRCPTPIRSARPRADDLAADCRSARRPVDGPVGPRPGIHAYLYRPDGRAAGEHWPAIRRIRSTLMRLLIVDDEPTSGR